MERFTKRTAVLILLVVALLAGGCGRWDHPQEQRVVIGLCVPSLSHPFFIHLKDSVMDEAGKLGVEVTVSDAQDVAAKQMDAVEDFIARGVDGVLISPIGADSLVPAVEALNRAGIPVATVDRKVSGGKVLVHVGADNVEGGRVAARYLLKKLGGKGGVIELEGTPGASAAMDRKRGFEELLTASPVKLLASQSADFRTAKAHDVMQSLLEVQHDFQAVYAANDEMILGAIGAMEAKENRPEGVVTVGYDASPEALKSIRQGRLSATVEQFPGQQGRQALRLLVANIKHGQQPPQKEVYIKPLAIDKDNLDQAERKEP